MSTTNGMTPTPISNGAGEQKEIGQIRPKDIVGEMQVAYLDYAMSVIVARALPDVRDGLKPVHRRILYAIYADLGLTHDKPHKKSARVVGEVLGKYHPHGDVAVYDAMVRMAQPFSLRYPLIDGQGNFGSIDGDSPAAMRYTEARLAEISDLMLTDLEKETVGWHDNFDNTLLEPDVLPSALPNLLINGSNGIAVGMATNIPPHNLGEVVDALAYLIDHYAKVEDITVEQLMGFIQGPDFPTGGILYRYRQDDKSDEQVDAIAQGYAVGKSRLVLQAKAHFEEMSRGRSRIVITELPYQTNKTTLIERIADLVRDGKLEGIADLRDESDRTGMRVMIELKRDVEPKSVLADLFKYTPLQQTFGMQMLALSENQPRMLSLKRMLHLFVQHREEVVRRRSEFELKRARERAHIVEGLLKALDILDEVIHTIRHSQTVDTARRNLVANFKFTEIQAQAILDMQLRRLAALERKKLQDEFKELRDRIAYLEDLLAHPEKILAVIKAELLAIKEKYGDARRTQIVDRTKGTLTTTDLIPEQAVWLSISANGDLRRQEVGKVSFTTLRQLGKGGDVAVLTANTRDTLYLFTPDGRGAKVAIHELPADGSGKSAAELSKLNPRDRLSAALTLPAALMSAKEAEEKAYLFLVTEQGMVKRITLADFLAAVINTPTVMGVDEKDRLGWVCLTQGNQEVLLVTAEGQAIRFSEEEVRSMGLAAGGVGGIKLKKGDKVVYATSVEPSGELITLTAQGFAKRSTLTDYPSQGRNGGGIVTHKLSERTGNVVTALLVNQASAGEMVLIITRKGGAKPIALAEIPVMGRGVLGKSVLEGTAQEPIVKLLRVQSGSQNGSTSSNNDDNSAVADKPSVEAPKDKIVRATASATPTSTVVTEPVTNGTGGANGKPVVDQPNKPAPERPPLTAPIAKPTLAASSPRKTVVADPALEQAKGPEVKSESKPPVAKTELTKPSPATAKATPIVDTQMTKDVTAPVKPVSTGAEVVKAVPSAPRADALSNFVAEKLSGKVKSGGHPESAMPTSSREPQHPPTEERPVQTSLFGVDLSPRTPGASTPKAKKVETVVSVPASQADKGKKK